MLEVLTPVTPLTLSALADSSNHTRGSATEKQDMSTVPSSSSPLWEITRTWLVEKEINITHVYVYILVWMHAGQCVCCYYYISVLINVINSLNMQAWISFIHVMSSTATLGELESKQGVLLLCDWSVLVGEHCCYLLHTAKKHFSHHIYWIWSLNHCRATYNLQLW